MPPPASNPGLLPFDLETGVRVASKLGNLPFKFEHARLLGSRIIRYVRDGRTDIQTDKNYAYGPLLSGCSGAVVEYRTRNREVAVSTHTWSTASNLEQVANLLCVQANSASYPQRLGNE